MSATVINALNFWSRTKPDFAAIDFDGAVLSYAELNTWVGCIASDLTTRGVGPGDRVGLVGANSLEWCAAALGAFAVGAVAAPFNNRMVARELADLVEDCQPSVVFADDALKSRFDEVRSLRTGFEIATFERDVRRLRGVGCEQWQPTVVEPDSATAIVFTSGSTGRPKGVVFTHRTIAGIAHEWALMEPMSAGNLRPLLVLPLFSAAGIIWGIARTVLNGGTLLLQPRFDPTASLRVLIECKPNTLTAPPIVFEQIAKVDGFESADLGHLSTAHVGGARVPIDLLRTWLKRGVALRQLYGQTEIGGTATVTPAAEAALHPESCGAGSIFTKVRVIDSAGKDCAPDQVGEIVLRGPGMMPGYWRNDEATSEAFIEGWLRTGDLGKLDKYGNLVFIDRLKDMIISGGLNIAPAEIEAVIQSVTGVDEVVVIGVPDQKFGETPAALIYASGNLSERSVIDHCNVHLADYKAPRYVVLCDEPLPRLASGKFAKPFLRTMYADIPARYERVR